MALVNITSATVSGDDVNVVGTVDGVAATVHLWLSHLSTLGTNAAKLTYAAQQLKASVPAATAPVAALQGQSATV